MNEQPPFFVTWCRDQNAFHTETLDEMLQSNMDNYFDLIKEPPDWIVVGVAHSRQEAYELAEALRKTKERERPSRRSHSQNRMRIWQFNG